MTLGNRMKSYYENRNKYYLHRRTPVIIRIDGKAFHSYTKHMNKPFDNNLSQNMKFVAIELCKEIQGAKCAYVQSDEISILLIDYSNLKTEAWFNYNIQKVSSISASLATGIFNSVSNVFTTAYFDARCFNLPKEEICNYFIWRQQDWKRNSLSMLARSHYSQKELLNKKESDIHQMLYNKGVNWANLQNKWKNGVFITYDENLKWNEIYKCPDFKKSREVIDNLVYVGG